jgi:hypothetical protein
MPPLALKFLTEDEHLIELARLYWELDQEEKGFPHQVKDLAARFSVPANKLLKTVLQNCTASSLAIACETCGQAQQYSSRNEFLEKQRRYRHYSGWQCWDCIEAEDERHREEERQRRELAAQQARAIRQHQQELIEKAYARQEARDYLLPTELSLTTAIYLISSLKAGGPVRSYDALETSAEEGDKPDALSPWIIKYISPTKSFDVEILDRLKSRGLIAISPTSAPEAFEFEQDLIVGYNSERVSWDLLPNVPADQRSSFIREVEDRLVRHEHRTWRDEWPEVWKKITIEECIQFLTYSLERHHFTYTPDRPATELFSELVDNYSLAQVFKLIDKVTKDFADFARQQRWPMKTSRVVEKIRSNVQYYCSQGWNIFAFQKRPPFPAQSVISRIFFDTVLRIGDDGFLKAPKDIDPAKLECAATAEHV